MTFFDIYLNSESAVIVYRISQRPINRHRLFKPRTTIILDTSKACECERFSEHQFLFETAYSNLQESLIRFKLEINSSHISR